MAKRTFLKSSTNVFITFVRSSSSNNNIYPGCPHEQGVFESMPGVVKDEGGNNSVKSMEEDKYMVHHEHLKHRA